MALLLIFSVLFLYCFPLLFMLGLNTFFRLFTVFFCPVFLIMAIWFISAVLRVVDSSLYFRSPHSSLPPILYRRSVVFLLTLPLHSPSSLGSGLSAGEKENRFLSPYKWIIATMFWRRRRWGYLWYTSHQWGKTNLSGKGYGGGGGNVLYSAPSFPPLWSWW